MSKLGYTWYPKDWASSKRVFNLTLAERGLYRELIDSAMLTDNKQTLSINVWARMFNSNEDEISSVLESLKNYGFIEIKGETVFLPECEPRLNLKRGGEKGGKNKPTTKPNIKPTTKPTLKQIESKSKREIESKIEMLKAWGEDIVSANDFIWEQMKGRRVSQSEMDSFLSVAVRNKWKIDTQQEFRYTLKGFQPNGHEPKAPVNPGKLQ